MSFSTMSRRRFIKTVAISSGAVAIGGQLTGCAPARFLHGVASGDPLQDRAVIWTRVTPVRAFDHSISVAWAVATDPGCRNIVGSGVETTDASRDFTLKLDVTGLTADTVYYFRFYANGGESTAGFFGGLLSLPQAVRSWQ